MSKSPVPTEIQLHQNSRVLEISFEDAGTFELSCEFLRVYSPSAEVRGHHESQAVLQVGKEKINIERIEPVGNYAVALHFDDGHRTGLYSWDYFYYLGQNKAQLWQEYLDKLAKAGHVRHT